MRLRLPRDLPSDFFFSDLLSDDCSVPDFFTGPVIELMVEQDAEESIARIRAGMYDFSFIKKDRIWLN